MKQFVLAITVLLAMSGIAWAGKEAYRLVMSKDTEVCSAILALFNDDLRKHGAIQYDYHNIFVSWQPMSLPDETAPGSHCGEIRKAVLDIDNNGQDEIVLRTSLCWHSVLTDSLFIFSKTSEVPARLSWRNMGELLSGHSGVIGAGPYELVLWPQSKKGELRPTLSDPWVLELMVLNGTAYVSMTDRNYGYIAAIAKYRGGSTLEDICYFEQSSR
ncbi:MAG: hypothetical protein AB1555_06215 [Nitrospirota bacterium]